MKSFILLTFGLLGWVFFEMSDGLDFQPPINPVQANAAPVLPLKVETAALSLPLAARITPLPSVSNVAAAVIRPIVFRSPASSSVTEVPSVTLVSLEQSPTQFGRSLDGFDPNAVRLVSSPVQQEPELEVTPELPPVDLRTVAGTRVNMRNGPGTTYGIISRVSLGDEVEVLDDSSQGWLRLRLVSNQTVGWISTSLVSKPSR